MVVVHNKRFILVVFILLCFISIQVRARTHREKSNIATSTKDASSANHKETVHDHVLFKPKDADNSGEVFSMDYTPARRKPPIHN
ncbi:uncharacterized protein LOC113873525 [Abrus precatorius]|uniref:Uncharacterized protein LOC113873525 n=1 Tax=Abrus precatorius TaxID=3816 RepID=A0A8B8MFJ4_ABRPR|nr:uncharacterized protein LOC113873525 [Abrus precatorius]